MVFRKKIPSKRYRPSARARANIRAYRPKGMPIGQYQVRQFRQRALRAQSGLQARQVPNRRATSSVQSSYNGLPRQLFNIATTFPRRNIRLPFPKRSKGKNFQKRYI